MNRERALLSLGIILTAIYFLDLIILAALNPDYSHMSNWVSDLGRIEAPHHEIFNVVGFLIGILFLLTGLGFFYSLHRITKRKVLAVFIGSFVSVFGINLIFAVLFPLPDPRHSAFGIGFLTFFAPILLAWACWRIPNSRAFAILQILSFILILLSSFGANAFTNSGYLGLFQRIQAVIIFGWLTYSCLWLMR